MQLIRAYLVRGHMAARIDPLGVPRPSPPELEPAFHGLSDADLDRPVSTHGVPGPPVRPLREILDVLRAAYCGSIGAQFMHIDDRERRAWLRARMEDSRHRGHLTREEQLRILTRLTDAVIFEEFIRHKYPGAKSFSLEGAESLIPLLDLAIETAGGQGVGEIVLGMAHRGRLNVLANVLGKPPREIFGEFEDREDPLRGGRGDVKYHLGHSTDRVTASGRAVHLSLCFNPSHLEFVNPVALGRVRAKQDRAGDGDRVRGMALLIHGDASFAGEGVIQESLNLSQLDGYRTGGTLHVIVNNQIGFTTPPEQARSSPYASDVARMLQIPIFHVNGEDPDAVARVVRLAMEFRRTFRSDAVIDMYCYRRRGHNEGDEPAFTQPIMYRVIERRPPVREGYLERLLALDGLTREDADRIAVERRAELERELAEARSPRYVPAREKPTGVWSGYQGGSGGDAEELMTGVARRRLVELIEALVRLPEGFRPHPKITRGLARRRETAEGTRPIDWSTAEALAFATLAVEGHRVRLSGQDTARGTFSHRHAVLHDVADGRTYMPLGHLATDQASVEVYNSPLSEVGVLGFEYGYSLDCPGGLVLWEAQFGDFVNGAQVVIDEFISSGEAKWNQHSGVVLLLPHGYEGQGPDHSSARIERFLTLAAGEAFTVAQPSSAASHFHLLRRHSLDDDHRPLVIFTPKQLLRRKEAASQPADFTEGSFRPIIGDDGIDPESVEKVLLCSGRVTWDLFEERRKQEGDDLRTAIVRFEQLYPRPVEELKTELGRYPNLREVRWVQDEPANMGPWPHMALH
ncbi:MAG: multifunctional oxoglutarate decarboxylase/oxoglutarate dehydrogenase thiamine pyrophosphate-binding subunit/dihydrolipoyllysine-residue succinyltransferase subunit, partial [Candidatus Rokuibacteriota bacterium]